MIRFAVYPGPIWSVNDDDRHFIGPNHLMQLYHVRPEECVVIEWGETRPRGYTQEFIDSLLPLRPMNIHYAPVTEGERALFPCETDT